MDLERLINFSQKVIYVLSTLGSRLIEFMTKSFNIGNMSFTLFELMLGTGLIFYLELKIIKAIIGLS